MTVTFEMSEDELTTVCELIENNIMDLEDNGRDNDPEAHILRDFLEKIRPKK